jgi:hypothetical protein
MMVKRIVVIATLDVAATYQVGGLISQCATAMRGECRDAEVVVLDAVTKMDLTGTLVIDGRLTTDRRRIGIAITVRVSAMALAVELRDRCEGRVRWVLNHSKVTGAVAPYIADPDNGMSALPTFR